MHYASQSHRCFNIKLHAKCDINLINCINKHIERLFYFTSFIMPFVVVLSGIGLAVLCSAHCVCTGMQVTGIFLHLGSSHRPIARQLKGYIICVSTVPIRISVSRRLLSIQLNQFLDN